MKQENTISYTTEDLAELLQVSKLTVYDLIKKGEIPAYRVGRQMRVDASDLEEYKNRTKTKRGQEEAENTPRIESPSNLSSPSVTPPHTPLQEFRVNRDVIISGQEVVLDLLAMEIGEASPSIRTLRSHTGSLANLLSLVQGKADIVSIHLFDGDTSSYNLPYIRRILTGREYTVIRLLSRSAGFYVPKGNPKHINEWRDLTRNDIQFINRDLGSGIRVLTDERLRLEGIPPRSVSGYENCVLTHLAVASKVASGEVDVGIGIEKAADLVNVDFVPLTTEQYDLVVLKNKETKWLLDLLLTILQSTAFQQQLSAIQGYDFSQIGQLVYETP